MSASGWWVAAAVVAIASPLWTWIVAVADRTRVRNRVVAHSGGADGDRPIAVPLRTLTAPTWVQRRLRALDLGLDADRVWTGIVVGGAGVVASGCVVVGVALTAVLVVATVASAVVAAGIVGDRVGRRIERELPLLVDELAGALRTGASLPVALRRRSEAGDGPLEADLRQVSAWLDAGVPLRDALDRWHVRRPSPSVRLVVASLALTTGLGGSTAALDGVAATLRDRQAVALEARASSAQGRASALVLVATPFAFLAASAAYDARALTFLTTTPIGMGCLVLGLLLDLGGAAWMARAVRSIA